MYPEQRRAAIDGWLLLYILLNLALVGADVAYAHMPAYGRTPMLWWPVYAIGPFAVCGAYVAWPLLRSRRAESLDRTRRVVLRTALISAIIVGLVGAWLHFDSQRVWGYTLERFIFSAPILAPLMYAGLGGVGLIYLDVHDSDRRYRLYWSAATAGLAANAIVLLLDHAQNGFLHWAEIAGGALACLPIPMAAWTAWSPHRRQYFSLNRATALTLAAVGLIGLGYHLWGVISVHGFNVVHWHDGAPPAAPALLVDYALLLLLLTTEPGPEAQGANPNVL